MSVRNRQKEINIYLNIETYCNSWKKNLFGNMSDFSKLETCNVKILNCETVVESNDCRLMPYHTHLVEGIRSRCLSVSRHAEDCGSSYYECCSEEEQRELKSVKSEPLSILHYDPESETGGEPDYALEYMTPHVTKTKTGNILTYVFRTESLNCVARPELNPPSSSQSDPVCVEQHGDNETNLADPASIDQTFIDCKITDDSTSSKELLCIDRDANVHTYMEDQAPDDDDNSEEDSIDEEVVAQHISEINEKMRTAEFNFEESASANSEVSNTWHIIQNKNLQLKDTLAMLTSSALHFDLLDVIYNRRPYQNFVNTLSGTVSQMEELYNLIKNQIDLYQSKNAVADYMNDIK